MSTPLSHVLSVGITTILIVGLVSGAATFLDAHGDRTARHQMDTIANRLASELNKADTLGRQGDEVSLTATHPDSIAGSTYTARLADEADDCVETTDNVCLEVSATEYRYDAVVEIQNKTDLSMYEAQSGVFVIDSAGGDANPQAPTRSLDLSARVGIGSDVGAGPPPGVGSALERNPVAKFTFRPGQPEVDEPISFDAGESTDPDGTIEDFAWDFNNDGTFEENGSSSIVTKNDGFSTPGWQNVTLEVTDDSDLTNTYSREFRVSGLRYNDDLDNATGTPRGIEFSVTNEHGADVELERILIDPTDDDLDELNAGSDSEIFIDASDVGYVDWTGPTAIPPDGKIVHLDEDGDDNGGLVDLDDGDTARITVRDFDEDVWDEEFSLGVRYRVVGGSYNAAVFNGTVNP